MRLEKIVGLILIGTAIGITMTFERLDLGMFISPSATAIVFGITIGATWMSEDKNDLKKCWLAFRTAFSEGVKCNQEELKIYVRLYSMLSRYSMYAGWFGLLLGIISVLSSLEQFIAQDKNFVVLSGGITLASMSLVYGTFSSKFIFDPLKNWFEWQIEHPSESGRNSLAVQTQRPPESFHRVLFKMILFLSFAITLIMVVILVSRKIGTMQK